MFPRNKGKQNTPMTMQDILNRGRPNIPRYNMHAFLKSKMSAFKWVKTCNFQVSPSNTSAKLKKQANEKPPQLEHYRERNQT